MCGHRSTSRESGDGNNGRMSILIPSSVASPSVSSRYTPTTCRGIFPPFPLQSQHGQPGHDDLVHQSPTDGRTYLKPLVLFLEFGTQRVLLIRATHVASVQPPAHFPLKAHPLPCSSYCAGQTLPLVGSGQDARGEKRDRTIVNDQVNGSGEGVEGGSADDGVCVNFPDCQMRLGAEEIDCIEDGGFVGSEDSDFRVRRA